MSRPELPKLTREKPKIVRRIVIFMDIRSSTSILEDLKQSDNQKEWSGTLNVLVYGLFRLQQTYSAFGMEVYKFLGDGWIVLFDENTPRDIICEFLHEASLNYDRSFDTILQKLLQRKVNVGLSFGIDSGELLRFQMHLQVEYVGRPLNIAARLQGSFIEDSPNYRAVASKPCFNSLRPGKSLYGPGTEGLVFEDKTTSLKNVLGGEEDFSCVMWQTL